MSNNGCLGTLALSLMAAAGIGFAVYERVRNVPAEYVGFDVYEAHGYKPVAYDLPTQGDVVRVELLGQEGRNHNRFGIHSQDAFPPSEEGYTITTPTGDLVTTTPTGDLVTTPAGDLQITGQFRYTIRPERRFAPNDENHSDFSGNTPFEEGGAHYWTDTRHGSVTLKMEKKVDE